MKVVLLPEVALIDLSVASTLGVARGGKKKLLRPALLLRAPVPPWILSRRQKT